LTIRGIPLTKNEGFFILLLSLWPFHGREEKSLKAEGQGCFFNSQRKGEKNIVYRIRWEVNRKGIPC
jgi:hypothetical protein